MISMIPKSGHTICAPHIENPVHAFFVRWYSPVVRTAALTEIEWEPGWRYAKVLAETGPGAVRIAEYHHFLGQGHELMREHGQPISTVEGQPVPYAHPGPGTNFLVDKFPEN